MVISTATLILMIGVISGCFGTIVGAGGGFIFVPALLLILNMDPVLAAGSGLIIVFINSITGVVGYAKQNKIDYKIAFMIGLSALPGSLIGIWLLQTYSSRYFHLLFATILVGLGLFLFSKNLSIKKTTPSKMKWKLKIVWLIPLGIIMGVLSSYLGIGGGWLLVPVLIYIFHVPTHRAAATSILSLCLYTSVGVISQLYYNNIDLMTVFFGGIGVIFGANIGVILSKRIPGKAILQMLSVLLILIGVRLYFN